MQIGLLATLLLPFFLLHSNHEKFVIGPHGAGFFVDFFGALNQIAWCEKEGKTPVIYWNEHSKFQNPNRGNENAWEYYFEPVSKMEYQLDDPISYVYFIDPNHQLTSQTIDLATRRRVSQLIRKYIRIKPSIEEKVEGFYSTQMKGFKNIGIHLRGTDKVKDLPLVPIDKILDFANQFASEKTQFFIASDDLNLFEEAKRKLKGTVIFSNAFRTATTDYEWWQYEENRRELGEEVLVDMLLLSRCDLLIHTPVSSVSAAALYYNPNLLHYRIGY